MRLIKITFVLILLSAISYQQAFSQEADKAEMLELYDSQAIYIYHDFLGNWFVKNAQIMPLGRFGSNLRKELAGSKDAVEEMENAKKRSKTGFIFGFFSTSIALTGTILEIADVDYSHKREIYASMVVSSAILARVSYGYKQSALSAMNRAVWLYNRDLVSGRLRDIRY
jgi:hypothetical protein